MSDAQKGKNFLNNEVLKVPRLDAVFALSEELHELKDKGLQKGFSTGWATLDGHYTVHPGQLTIITGWPGHGKSEFLDHLMINLAGAPDFKFAVFSFENNPCSWHIAKLMEKMSGMAFNLIDKEEINEYLDDLGKNFALCRPVNGNYKLNQVLEAAEAWLKRFPDSPKGMVIDPWNELEHRRESQQNETDYISKSLSMIKNWAHNNRVHVWIVAHPQKMARDNKNVLPVPRSDNISGSQNWFNKADVAITVYVDEKTRDAGEAQIHVQKVRNKNIGRPGLVTLYYNRVNGRYSETDGELM